MPELTNKNQKKCREWERIRRNRLSAAFSDLAAVIPDVSTPATKILILQKALQYIKQLQEKDSEKENRKYHENEELRKEISQLEEKCTMLVKQLEEFEASKKISKEPDIPIVQKELPKIPQQTPDSSDSECSNDSDRINDNSSPEPEKIENAPPKQVATKVTSLNKDRKKVQPKLVHLKKKKTKRKTFINRINGPVISGMPIGNITPLQSNFWVANNNFGTLGTPVIVGNNILPITPMPPPIILPSLPQQTGYVFLQKPNIKKQKTFFNSMGNITVMNPVQGNPLLNTYPGIYGVDVTKTTMVNKVPIPAISSTNTATFKSSDTVIVSYQMRRKFLSEIKQSKKAQPSGNINKENIKCKSKVKIVESKCVKKINKSELITKSSISENNFIESNKNEETSKINSAKSKVPSNNKESTVVTNSATKNKCHKPFPTADNSTKAVQEKKKLETLLSETISKATEPKTDAKISSKDIIPKPSLDMQADYEFKKTEQFELCNSSTDSKNCVKENAKIKKSNQSISNQQSVIASQESVNLPDCRIEMMKSLKKADISIGSVEITDDLLASFGATNEQNMTSSPLAASPLATSPTAAFLLTFPLVSQGPRPDTPSNDNLQTPNICSLDHFSNFFSSKDNIASSNTNFYIDFNIKQPINATPEKNKQASENIVESKLTPLQVPTSTGKYAKEIVPKNILEHNFNQKHCISSSSCIFSESQNIFHFSKPQTTNVHSSLSDSIFNYEHAAIMTNVSKYTKPVSKPQISCDNMEAQNPFKTKLSTNENHTFYNSPSTNFFDPTLGTNKNNSYNLPVVAPDVNTLKKVPTTEPQMKLVVPGVIPEFNTMSKPLDIPFSFTSQARTYPSSNIYTTCNTYNQFNSDVPNSGQPTNIKSKMGYYEPNLSNNYVQCNTWTEDNMAMAQKVDQPKKYNLPYQNINSLNNNPENQAELKYSAPIFSKTSNKSSMDVKPRNALKFNSKETNKYVVSDTKPPKTDFTTQKGPVNWMTSESNAIQFNSNDMFFQVNNKDVKPDQMITGQHCVDPTIHSSLGCRKGDLFDQPYYHLPSSSYVPQTVNEDNQFTWSPSKLAPLGDNNMPITSCSLPTLVGDLALGVLSDSKHAYQQPNADDSGKDPKQNPIKVKEGINKNNNNHSVDIPPSNTSGNFFSVTQLMERGKESSGNDSIRKNYNLQCQKKPQPHPNEVNYKMTNPQTSFMPTYSSDSFPVQNIIDSNIINKPNIKTETNNKNVNKINYSAEALLQNNQTEYNIRKYKHLQKSHESSNVPANTISGYPIQFDAYNQTSQYMTNSFPYGNTPSVSNTFYTSSNFIPPSNNMMSSSYINSGLLSDVNEFSNSTSDNIFFIPKLENSRKTQPDNNTQHGPKDFVLGKHKLEGTKKEPSTKRQKKPRNLTEQFNNMHDKSYPSIGNNLVPSVASDEAFFGYFTPSQSHSYSTQTGTLPGSQSMLQPNQRNNASFGKSMTSQIISSSPIPVSSSLTNFNLSTIFPEINKRNAMPGMQYTAPIPTKPPVLLH